MKRLLVLAEMTGREIVRRRMVLVLLLLFPLPFYLSRRGDHTGQSIRFLFLGLSWAVSAAALFVGQSGRTMEQRLRLSGYRPHDLWLGRAFALWGVGLIVAVPYFALIAVDLGARHDLRLGAIAVAMLLCVAVAAPFGLLLGAVVPRELEGTLLLLVTAGMQLMIDPASSVARVLPYWSGREIGTYAIDHTGTGYLVRGVTHGVLFTLGLAVVLAVVSAVRLRRRPHLRSLPA